MARRVGFGSSEPQRERRIGGKRFETAKRSPNRGSSSGSPSQRDGGAQATRPDTDSVDRSRSSGLLWLFVLIALVVAGYLFGTGLFGPVPDDWQRTLDDAVGPGGVELPPLERVIDSVAPFILPGLFAVFVLSTIARGRRKRHRDTDTGPAPFEGFETPREARNALDDLRQVNPQKAEELIAAAETAGSAFSGIARFFIAGFLLLWLTGWSAGILIIAGQLLIGLEEGFDEGAGFAAIWLVIALVAWYFAARAFWAVVSGKGLKGTSRSSRKRTLPMKRSKAAMRNIPTVGRRSARGPLSAQPWRSSDNWNDGGKA
ncbi:MAG: hypothetical protein AAFV62_02485 [Pseudomonadota bacterium]